MDIRQLAAFHKVATLLSFSKAATELKYAQSSVTSQIKGLEMSLGVDLFDRLGGRIQLTEAGQRLLPYAEQMLALAGEARGATVGSGDPSGVLTIGSIWSALVSGSAGHSLADAADSQPPTLKERAGDEDTMRHGGK